MRVLSQKRHRLSLGSYGTVVVSYEAENNQGYSSIGADVLEIHPLVKLGSVDYKMTPTISGNPALLATDNGHYYIPGNGLHSYHINNTDGLNLYKNFSGATWIWVGKVNSTSTTQRLWGTGSGTNIIRSRCNLTSGGTISLQNRMADADTSVIVTSSSGTIVANNPYVIFGVADYTNNVQTLYVNGTSVATGIITVSGTRALPNTAPTTRFPRVLSCPVDPAVTTGRLFAFALLSNVLNSTQVAALYAAYKRKFHNLGLP